MIAVAEGDIRGAVLELSVPSLGTGIELARTEGLMVGPTTGALLHAARITGADARGTAVVISPDDAGKYISSYAAYLEAADAG